MSIQAPMCRITGFIPDTVLVIALVSFSQFLSPSPWNFPLHHKAIYEMKKSQKLSTCKFSKPVQNSENICTQKNGLYE